MCFIGRRRTRTRWRRRTNGGPWSEWIEGPWSEWREGPSPSVSRKRRMPESIPAPRKRPVCPRCQGNGYQGVWASGGLRNNQRCVGCRGSGYLSTSRTKTPFWRTLTLALTIAIAGYLALSATSPETIDELMNSWSGLFDEMFER